MYKMGAAMFTRLNELRLLAEVDCYKGRLCITFSINFGMATIKVIQNVWNRDTYVWEHYLFIIFLNTNKP